MRLQPIDREVLLKLVKERSPVLPLDLKRALNQGDSLLLGAMLSELVARKLVKITHVKLGGSPYYYDPEKPESIEKAASNLNEKDYRTYNLLKESKVLRDDEHDALTRVSLRNIKDYAINVPFTTPDGVQLSFWRYYLVTEAEAVPLIRQRLGIDGAATPPPAATLVTPQPLTSATSSPIPSTASPPPTSLTPSATSVTPPSPPSPSVAVADVTTAPAPAKPKRQSRKKSVAATAGAPVTGTAAILGVQQTLPSAEPVEDNFYGHVKRVLEERGARVLEGKVVKKEAELDLLIELQTPFGPTAYYCKAKSKKKSSEADVIAAKLEGNTRHLPVLYLSNGEVAKKALDLLSTTCKGMLIGKV